MPSKKWSGLNHMQLGQFGEYYAKMEFASYMTTLVSGDLTGNGENIEGIESVNPMGYTMEI